VHVVPARVHRRLVAALEILDHRGAGVGNAGRFLQRQRVHVGAEEHRGPRPVAEHAHHPQAAHFLRDVDTERAQLLGDQRRRLHLHERQLRMRVEVFVDDAESGVFAADLGEDGLTQVGA
jgi:hypothetical protein